jgi:predicted nuclease of predicted toxin-antitoxin system
MMSARPSKKSEASKSRSHRGEGRPGRGSRGKEDESFIASFLIDEDVPHSVARVLEREGQVVRYVADELGQSTPDGAVAAYANDICACVVTFNSRDFKRLTNRRETKLRKASCIFFSCAKVEAARRAEVAMSIILMEVNRPNDGGDRRVFIEVRNDKVIILR